MYDFFEIGDKIYGYCNGFFGRDHYDDMICIAVTQKYAVFEYINGDTVGNAQVINLSEIQHFEHSTIRLWTNPSESYAGYTSGTIIADTNHRKNCGE